MLKETFEPQVGNTLETFPENTAPIDDSSSLSVSSASSLESGSGSLSTAGTREEDTSSFSASDRGEEDDEEEMSWPSADSDKKPMYSADEEEPEGSDEIQLSIPNQVVIDEPPKPTRRELARLKAVQKEKREANYLYPDGASSSQAATLRPTAFFSPDSIVPKSPRRTFEEDYEKRVFVPTASEQNRQLNWRTILARSRLAIKKEEADPLKTAEQCLIRLWEMNEQRSEDVANTLIYKGFSTQVIFAALMAYDPENQEAIHEAAREYGLIPKSPYLPTPSNLPSKPLPPSTAPQSVDIPIPPSTDEKLVGCEKDLTKTAEPVIQDVPQKKRSKRSILGKYPGVKWPNPDPGPSQRRVAPCQETPDIGNVSELPLMSRKTQSAPTDPHLIENSSGTSPRNTAYLVGHNASSLPGAVPEDAESLSENKPVFFPALKRLDNAGSDQPDKKPPQEETSCCVM